MTASTLSAATLSDAERAAARFSADPAALERALEDVTFHTPPRNQNQVVEVSYGADCGGLVFRRTHDRSDRSVSYEVADVGDCGCDSECDCFEPWNEVPSGFVWLSVVPTPEPMEYTYSIFDSNPASGGDAWPDFNGEPVDVSSCGSPEDALAYALDVAETMGATCGEYATGDRLWVIVYGPEQTHTGSVVLEIEADDDGGEVEWLGSCGLRDWEHGCGFEVAWERGVGDAKRTGVVRSDGARAIVTNGDPVFEGDEGFEEAWGTSS